MPAIADIAADSLKIKYPLDAVKTFIQEKLEFTPRLRSGVPPGARVSDGYQLNWGARLNPAQNVAQIGDGANFVQTKEATDRQFVTKPTIFAGSFQASLLMRYVANSSAAAFNGGEMKRRPQDVMSNLGKLIESTYIGTDGSGIRGYVASDGVNTLVLKNPQGVRFIPENAYISVRQSAGGSVRDSLDLRKITAKNASTNTLTYDGADQTAVADDPVYIVAEPTQTLTSIYANGLRGQVDDGTYSQFLHTLDRTAAGNGKLKSIVLENGFQPRNLTEDLLLSASLAVQEVSELRPKTLVMNTGQVRKYVEFVTAQRVFPAMGDGRSGKATGLKAYNELKHSAPGVDLDFLVSFDCVPGEIYGVSWDSFYRFSAVDAQWLSGHDMGDLLLLPGSNGSAHKAAWGAYCVSVENWGTLNPQGNFVIRDLKDALLGTA